MIVITIITSMAIFHHHYRQQHLTMLTHQHCHNRHHDHLHLTISVCHSLHNRYLIVSFCHRLQHLIMLFHNHQKKVAHFNLNIHWNQHREEQNLNQKRSLKILTRLYRRYLIPLKLK